MSQPGYLRPAPWDRSIGDAQTEEHHIMKKPGDCFVSGSDCSKYFLVT
jgi:hypothetical protein